MADVGLTGRNVSDRDRWNDIWRQDGIGPIGNGLAESDGNRLTEWMLRFCQPCADAARCETEAKQLACFADMGLPVERVRPEPTTEELLWLYYQ